MRLGLDIPPGLVSDDTSFVAAGRFEDGSNVRFWRGRPQVIGGWSCAVQQAVNGKCRSVLSWSDNGAELNVAFGTNTKLQVMVGGELFDVTPPSLAAGAEDGAGPGYGGDGWNEDAYGTPRINWYPRTWSLSLYGQSLIANVRFGKIYQWNNDIGAAAAPVTNAPEEVAYALVTPERQLLAFGCNEETSGSFNPLCIRGSDIEDITDWTTSASNNAFEHILEGGGSIVAARLFGSGVAVWTDNAVHFGQFVGDPGQAYRFDRVEDNCGLIGPNAVTIINQTAYWIGPDKQPRFWPLGGTPQIIACPIRSDFADNLAEAQSAKIVATSNSRFSEVWFFYPDERDGTENSRYFAMSTLDQSWFRGTLARTAACDAGVAGYPLKVTPDGEVFYHELGHDANGGNLEWFLKTADQYLDEGGRQFTVRGVSPDFEDQQGAISLTITMRPYPQGTGTVHGPYTLAAGGSKADFRASGAVAAIKFSGASNPSYMRAGKPVFDVVPRGRR